MLTDIRILMITLIGTIVINNFSFQDYISQRKKKLFS